MCADGVVWGVLQLRVAPSQSKHKLYVGNIPKELTRDTLKEQISAVAKGEAPFLQHTQLSQPRCPPGLCLDGAGNGLFNVMHLSNCQGICLSNSGFPWLFRQACGLLLYTFHCAGCQFCTDHGVKEVREP